MLTLVYEALSDLKSGYHKHDEYPWVTTKLSRELLYSDSETEERLTQVYLNKCLSPHHLESAHKIRTSHNMNIVEMVVILISSIQHFCFMKGITHTQRSQQICLPRILMLESSFLGQLWTFSNIIITLFIQL